MKVALRRRTSTPRVGKAAPCPPYVHRRHDSGVSTMLCTRRVGVASDALVDAPGVRGRLLAERLTGASPLPWLQADPDHGIEGSWLLCAALDECHAPADTAICARLPVGACCSLTRE